jgi:hypothetical protein
MMMAHRNSDFGDFYYRNPLGGGAPIGGGMGNPGTMPTPMMHPANPAFDMYQTSPQDGLLRAGMPQGSLPMGIPPQGGFPQGGMPQGGLPQVGLPQAPQGAMPQGPAPPQAYGSPVSPYYMSPIPRAPVGGLWNQQAQQMAGPMYGGMQQPPTGYTGQIPSQLQSRPVQPGGGILGGGPPMYAPISLAALGGGQ